MKVLCRQRGGRRTQLGVDSLGAGVPGGDGGGFVCLGGGGDRLLPEDIVVVVVHLHRTEFLPFS